MKTCAMCCYSEEDYKEINSDIKLIEAATGEVICESCLQDLAEGAGLI